MKRCIFAGVFDPPHKGHENIIKRLLGLFEGVTVAVLCNAQKNTLTDGAVRAGLLKEIFASEQRVSVREYQGLLTDFARAEGIFTVARALRGAADFSYEQQLCEIYKSQCPEIEVVYLAAEPALAHISSTAVRELISLGGDISGYVKQSLQEKILNCYGKQSGGPK